MNGSTTSQAGEEGVCMYRNGAKLPFGRKSQNSFLCPLFHSWEWIKFLESPCEEGRQEPSEFLMAPLSGGNAFLSAIWAGFKSTKYFLILCFPSSLPPSRSLWKAEVQLFLIAHLKLSWVLCFWTWPNDYSLRDHFYQKCFVSLENFNSLLKKSCLSAQPLRASKQNVREKKVINWLLLNLGKPQSRWPKMKETLFKNSVKENFKRCKRPGGE